LDAVNVIYVAKVNEKNCCCMSRIINSSALVASAGAHSLQRYSFQSPMYRGASWRRVGKHMSIRVF